MEEANTFSHQATSHMASAPAASAPASASGNSVLLSNMSFSEKILHVVSKAKSASAGKSSACFDVFAALWVFSMEKAIPTMHREMQQTEIMDNLYQTRSKLQTRKQELSFRLRDILMQAQTAQRKKDLVVLKNRILSARRIRSQVQKMDNAILIMDDNIDSILNNEVHKDIISSLQQATTILKAQITDIGDTDGVAEIMSSLDEEMKKQSEITDTLCKPPDSLNLMLMGGTSSESNTDLEEELANELSLLLNDNNYTQEDAVATNKTAIAGARKDSMEEIALVVVPKSKAKNTTTAQKRRIALAEPASSSSSLAASASDDNDTSVLEV